MTGPDTADRRSERFNTVAEHMPRIAKAISAFDTTLKQQAYYTLLFILDPEPAEPDERLQKAEDGRRYLAEQLIGRLDDRAFYVERAEYDRACLTIADMHAAAVGEVRGPIRGVVEDVEDLRARCLAAERGQPVAAPFEPPGVAAEVVVHLPPVDVT